MTSDTAGFGMVPRHLRGKLTCHELAVYVALSWRLNEAGTCWPSLDTIAAEAGMSKSSAQRALAALGAFGLVVKQQQTRDNGARTSNLYVLNLTRGHGHTDQGGWSERPGAMVSVTTEVDTDERDPLNETQGKNNTTAVALVVDPPPRPEVELLCEQLADAIEANGSKRPTVTKAWRDACRRMIDLDGRTPDQIASAIAWCQRGETPRARFWRPNVLSMPKLRDRYDQMRLQAEEEQRRTPTGNAQAHQELIRRLQAGQ